MKKLNYYHFCYVENNMVFAIYVFDPSTIDIINNEDDALIYLEAITSKPMKSFINCFNDDIVKGIYPEVGDKYNKETDVFSK